jgi:hypothetical protein
MELLESSFVERFGNVGYTTATFSLTEEEYKYRFKDLQVRDRIDIFLKNGNIIKNAILTNIKRELIDARGLLFNTIATFTFYGCVLDEEEYEKLSLIS